MLQRFADGGKWEGGCPWPGVTRWRPRVHWRGPSTLSSINTSVLDLIAGSLKLSISRLAARKPNSSYFIERGYSGKNLGRHSQGRQTARQTGRVDDQQTDKEAGR